MRTQARASFAILLLVVASAQGAAPNEVGLVESRPTTGRFVETERGFMVPYTIPIPGTNVAFSMEPIAGGTFLMGSPPSETGRNPDEGPQIEVTVPAFWFGKKEVRWAEYKTFMSLYGVFKDFETNKIRPVSAENQADAITAPTELYDPSFTFEFGEEDDQPAVTMTQYAAKQYTKWLSAITGHPYRLPSEAEWEYACRAGTTTAYSFGEDASEIDEYAWYLDNADVMPHPVGTCQPNAWGLHDMHGNVWEWVLDEYFEDGYQRLAGKKPTAAEAVAWPTVPYPRVVRGGSWDDEAEACRSASRMASNDPAWKSEDPNLPLSPWWFTSDPARAVGFRLLRPLNPLSREQQEKYWEADVEEIRFDVQSRLDEGRGALGLVDKELPEAIQKLKESR